MNKSGISSIWRLLIPFNCFKRLNIILCYSLNNSIKHCTTYLVKFLPQLIKRYIHTCDLDTWNFECKGKKMNSLIFMRTGRPHLILPFEILYMWKILISNKYTLMEQKHRRIYCLVHFKYYKYMHTRIWTFNKYTLANLLVLCESKNCFTFAQFSILRSV